MRFLIQNVQNASVEVDKKVIGSIQKGFLVFIGINQTDTVEIADKMIHKLLNLRVFRDDQGKTNLSLSDVSGALLLVSQFTLYADCRHGNRPSFTKAGAPDVAEQMYEYIIQKCRESGLTVETGSFGADMKVKLVNDGPFTIMLDSEEIIKSV
ncbi:MAG: D-tyrosyl-tRNA(Tyr) deacylase [Lachnospiraceae bacterium]|nr:D-tyrosyl-tRNA(Tyr) deacylase [Lachnospiraceae bacterium]